MTMREDIFRQRFEKLNKKQREAVETVEGPVMVIAGPGTGKTELLALRVAHILREGLATPSSVLCLTFTENACLNMRERLIKLIGEEAYRVPIFTFHSFSSYIMERFPEYFWDAASFTLADDIVRAELLETIFKKLPYGHPFASYHPSEGFVYLPDVKERIRHIKNGGYTGEEYEAVTKSLIQEYAEVNKLFSLWPEGRLSIKRLDEFSELESALSDRSDTTSKLLVKALRDALDEARENGKTEAVGSFKKKYTVSEDEQVALKDFHNKDKLEALAELYLLYEKEMYEEGYYDFDDMILRTSHALRDNSIMRTVLEEEYQYILVDEFQDTNEAQMDLIKYITSSPLHEGRPNVLVVGDDDQAIYKFQGAEVSHLLRFRDSLYRDVKTIVLGTNYRSTKEVLSFSRNVIVQGKDRLENHLSEMSKELESGNSNLPESHIEKIVFASVAEENTYIAGRIEKALASGVEGSEIAVLARGHKELQGLTPYLVRANIPFEYSKKANVFDEVHVRELILLSEYLSSFLEGASNKDYLLPEILSFPFFAISRRSLFLLSLEVKKGKHNGEERDDEKKKLHASYNDWLLAASESADPHVKKVAEFLIQMAGIAKSEPLLSFLKKLIEESGFKEYYFSDHKLREKPDDYVTFLSSLRTFLDALAEYKHGTTLVASDVAAFVDLHKNHHVALISSSPSVKKKNSISLLTAHAAKGLEFSTVFIVSARDDIWIKGKRGSKVPLPLALKPLLEPAGDNEDDFLRLFYVALTRAKHDLTITSHENMIRFLPQEGSSSQVTEQLAVSEEEMLESALSFFAEPYQKDEKEILQRLVEGYQMPVTHLQNFCNVTEGGPLYFLEQNLLRFPQPMNPSGVFGSAVHKAIEAIVLHKKYNGGELLPLARLLAVFDAELAKGRLGVLEEKKQRERGRKLLTKYREKEAGFFEGSDEIEVNFAHEGVVVDGAHLTGKIDFLRKGKDGYMVLDFKTGDAYESFNEGKLSDYEKHKLHKYKQQLIVYELLLTHSKKYTGPVASLALSFVEDTERGLLTLTVTEKEREDMKKLLGKVYAKIKACDFPDISSYEKNLSGVLAFENDIREGKI